MARSVRVPFTKIAARRGRGAAQGGAGGPLPARPRCTAHAWRPLQQRDRIAERGRSLPPSPGIPAIPRTPPRLRRAARAHPALSRRLGSIPRRRDVQRGRGTAGGSAEGSTPGQLLGRGGSAGGGTRRCPPGQGTSGTCERQRAAPCSALPGARTSPPGRGRVSSERKLSASPASPSQLQGRCRCRCSASRRTEDAPGKGGWPPRRPRGLPGSCAPPMHHPPRSLCHGSTCPLRMFARAVFAQAQRRGTLDTGGTQPCCRPPERARGGAEAARERCSAAPGRTERSPASRGTGSACPARPKALGVCRARQPRRSRAARRAGTRRVPHRPRDPRSDRAPPVPAPVPAPRHPPRLPALRAPPAAALGGDACVAAAVPGGDTAASRAPRTLRALTAQVSGAAGWMAPFAAPMDGERSWEHPGGSSFMFLQPMTGSLPAAAAVCSPGDGEPRGG
ncbi:transcription initiation factor TFIID subunit 4-like [Camarhynchus parvulus]|uniref:transcription initiation factor TFIID subunit 4-like n=1 Tax=Geospiza parvula TaxID=87175 RepID=UPI001237B374|nr:transcription initiation factor TFIID subunit 4-like [Camarhynchus parvulus]